MKNTKKDLTILEEGWFSGPNSTEKANAANEILDANKKAIGEKLLNLYTKNGSALVGFLDSLEKIKDGALKKSLATHLYIFFIYHGKKGGFWRTGAKNIKSKDSDIMDGAEAAAQIIEKIASARGTP